MSSPLSGIALEKRRQFAATLGLFAMLFIAVGAVAATGATTAAIKAFVVAALVIAVVLAMMAWGVLRSIKLDLAEQRLDAAITEAVQARAGGSLCNCGHEHDPTEMHLVGDERAHDGAQDSCSHDGSGKDCSHSCDTCVLAALRPASAPSTAQSTTASVTSAMASTTASATTSTATSAATPTGRRPQPGPRRA